MQGELLYPRCSSYMDVVLTNSDTEKKMREMESIARSQQNSVKIWKTEIWYHGNED